MYLEHLSTGYSRVDSAWYGTPRSSRPPSLVCSFGGVIPVLVPVRASPVPSVVRGSFVVKFLAPSHVKKLAPRPWILNALEVLQVPGPKTHKTDSREGRRCPTQKHNPAQDSYSRQGRDSDTLLTDLVLVWCVGGVGSVVGSGLMCV